MELRLRRLYPKEKYTIGKFYVNGEYFCDVLEDPVRDLNKDGDLDDAGEGKIPGNTAIPYDTYIIILSMSKVQTGIAIAFKCTWVHWHQDSCRYKE